MIHPSSFSVSICRFPAFLAVIVCLSVAPAYGEEKPSRNGMQHAADSEHVHPKADETSDPKVGLEEQLGGYIPLDVKFRDETGQEVTLRELIDGPTIIAPVYYTCPNVCTFIQGGLASVLPQVTLDPGEDFRVLSVSFDETENPSQAAQSKRNYYAAMKGQFPEEAWHFLTGTRENILRLTDSLGYNFQRQGKDFLHPIVVAVVSPDGKIVRYLHGTRFLPMDISLALVEASEGRVGATIKKVLGFCFSYDPQNRRYVFNLLRVAGAAVLLTLGAFLSFLLFTGRKKKS